ncbi:involucrin-like [Dendropsophus ebraccatus]|uniref:involucrin-like n=1 Tax=Dendropsophus ebraccatus TaxID=150705 RepID=UPI00383186DA
MGISQMADSDLSGIAISKGQEKPRKTSTESSQSPKATQPSCLRGAFIRIFLKRTEPNNRTEEDSTSNQNTDQDQEGVRGKKRRVTGGIFRLPCLRPAETTGNDIQDKTEEQGNDVVQEEELKPYSKASFLRKIRCYRLMREKDATEKEKVIEMGQRKHDRENAEGKQHKEKVLEQNEEGLQDSNHEEAVGEKGKDTTEQACHATGLGEATEEQDVNVKHVEEQENSLRKEERCTGKLPQEESLTIEDPTESLEGTGKDLAEQESCVVTVKEKSKGSLLDVKKVAEQESQIDKAEQEEQVLAGRQEEDVPEQRNHAAQVEDTDCALSDNVSQAEETGRQEKQEEALGTDSPKKDTEEPTGAVQKCNPESKCPTDVLGDSGNCVSEQEGLTVKVGNTENNVLEQQCLEKDMEQDGKKEKGLEDKDVTEQVSQEDKLENNVLEKVSREKNHADVDGGQEDNLVDQDSHINNEISQPGSQCTGKDEKTEGLVESEDKVMEVLEVSLDVKVEQNEPSEDVHTQVVELPKQVQTSTNTMDITFQEADILHTCVSNDGEDDGMKCKNTELGSLRVEVQDMVEWLVQEASDRLSHYTQESDGTG